MPVGPVVAPLVICESPATPSRLHAGSAQKQPSSSPELAAAQCTLRAPDQALSLRDLSVVTAVLRPCHHSRMLEVWMPDLQVEAAVARGADLNVRRSVLGRSLARRPRCEEQHKREQ